MIEVTSEMLEDIQTRVENVRKGVEPSTPPTPDEVEALVLEVDRLRAIADEALRCLEDGHPIDDAIMVLEWADNPHWQEEATATISSAMLAALGEVENA